uniref:Scavenger receptor class F member 1-like n=1 Tax=Crassostrea virginica TaxID=6565 RepID=A0A8B8EFB9_CRAVI|nr:scavenger receptor class F member 1-like [Crassostrea virginica]
MIFTKCIGSFGFECSKSCPEGYYGKQCSEKCHCKLCNSYSGECVNVTTEALNSPGDASKHSAFPLISILLGLCASIGSLATVVILLYKEKGRNRPLVIPFKLTTWRC